jgi:hypothetical protein
MTSSIDTHDDVALRDEETIAWWAMAHNMDDDHVPCNTIVMECPCEAEWSYRCSCGQTWTVCKEHRLRADTLRIVSCLGAKGCGTPAPSPIPWLPM